MASKRGKKASKERSKKLSTCKRSDRSPPAVVVHSPPVDWLRYRERKAEWEKILYAFPERQATIGLLDQQILRLQQLIEALDAVEGVERQAAMANVVLHKAQAIKMDVTAAFAKDEKIAFDALTVLDKEKEEFDRMLTYPNEYA